MTDAAQQAQARSYQYMTYINIIMTYIHDPCCTASAGKIISIYDLYQYMTYIHDPCCTASAGKVISIYDLYS